MKTRGAYIPQISIIMPVYNTPAQYLLECMNSVCAQTFREFEVIIIDDSSTAEDTLTLLEKYACEETYDKIRIISVSSSVGAAQARNIGLEQARGKYVIFLDSDDIFMPNMLECMYETIEKSKADICVCGYSYFVMEEQERVIKNRIIHSKSLQDMRLEENYLYIARMTPWTKLCRKDFLKRQGILFQSLTSCNDIYFSIMVLLLADKIETIIDADLILYRTQTKHQISANRDVYNLYRAIAKVLVEVEQRDVLNETVLRQILALLLKKGIEEYRICRNEMSRELFYQKVQELLDKYRLKFEDAYVQCLDEYWRKECTAEWMDLAGNYYEQLKRNIRRDIISDEKVLLWGYGKRGKAFEKWAYEKGITQLYIYDQNISGQDIVSEYGYTLGVDYQLIKKFNYIVASNTEIYNVLNCMEMQFKKKIINLELLCPL